MNSPKNAVLPAILLTSLLLIFLNRLVNPVQPAVAATEAVGDLVESRAAAKNTEPAECAFDGIYPGEVAGWCALIEAAAAKYGLDPLLIAAVMQVESGGQAEVISHSGAVGLMQVMPRDGIAAGFQCINGPCFSNRPTIEELKDPEFNVDYGARMLAGLQGRHGNMRDALKAYGPADVGYWYADMVLDLYANLSAETIPGENP